jgi:hypothetical protein
MFVCLFVCLETVASYSMTLPSGASGFHQCGDTNGTNMEKFMHNGHGVLYDGYLGNADDNNAWVYWSKEKCK